jgi:hypothetical protein
VGCVLASLLAEMCSMGMALWLLKINLLNGETIPRIGRAILAATGMAVVVWLVKQRLAGLPPGWGTILTLVVSICVGLLVFGGLAWILRILSHEEEQQIGEMIRQKFKPR